MILPGGGGGLIGSVSFVAGIFPVISKLSESGLLLVVHSSGVLVIHDNSFVVGNIGLEVTLPGDGVGSLAGEGSEELGPGVDSVFLDGGLGILLFLDVGPQLFKKVKDILNSIS